MKKHHCLSHPFPSVLMKTVRPCKHRDIWGWTRKTEDLSGTKKLKKNFSHREHNQVLREVIPAGDEVYLEKRVDRESGTVKTVPVLVKQTTLMTGEAIRTTRMEIGGRYNEPHVGLTFNDRGGRLFEKITAENVGRQELKDVINRSINEVLSRTIITSGTVFLVLMALLLTGGVFLRDFALALLIGVVVGTYSSIFVASPIVYIWPTSGKKRRAVLKSWNNRKEDNDGHR